MQLPWRIKKRRRGAATLFSGSPGLVSGIDRLTALPTLTVNSIAKTPTFTYRGKDATAATFPPLTYGRTLNIAGSGALPSLNQPTPFFGANDQSVNFNLAKYYEEPSDTAYGDLNGLDVIVEAFLCSGNTTEGYASKYSGVSSRGWLFLCLNSGKTIAWRMDGASATSTLVASANFTLTDWWYHVLLYVNISENSTNGSKLYLNGTQNGTSVNFSAIGSMANTFKVDIGLANSINVCSTDVGYFSLWSGANWIQEGAAGPTEIAALAKSRYHAFIGSGATLPTAWGSTSHAYQINNPTASIRKYYLMGANAIRFEVTPSSSFVGIVNEAAVQNLILQSETLNTTWTKTLLTSITNNSAAGPNGFSVLDGLIANAGHAVHGVSQAVTLTGAKYTFGCFAVKGDRNWIHVDNDTLNVGCYFDINNGVIGTADAGATPGMISLGSGLYLCWITFTGTAAAHTLACHPADSDLDEDINGDGATINAHLGCFFCHLGSHPALYIPTTTAAVTKATDTLIFPSTGLVSVPVGSMEFDFKAPAAGWVPTRRNTLLSINDGTANNYIDVFMDTSGRICAESRKTAGTNGDITGTGNKIDGSIHHVKCSWSDSALSLWVDGIAMGTDTAQTPPTSITQISVGQDAAGATNAYPVLVANYIFKAR
jgi:hypothetical protein